MDLVEEIVAMQEELASWRKDIHAHPELGFEETVQQILLLKSWKSLVSR